MIAAVVAGFWLGLGLILAIGAQNAFVLRQGIRGSHVAAVALTCALSDALLIAAGVAGAGILTERLPWITPVFRWGGAAFLIAYGALSLRSAMTGAGALTAAEDGATRLGPTLATCLALTWLNPHVYLDTMVLLGSVSAGYGVHRWAFGAGAILASFVFFFALAYGARRLAPVFARPVAWRLLDAGVAGVMWCIAAALILGG